MAARDKGRWDEGWVNSETREIRLQRRDAAHVVEAWRSYSSSGVDTGSLTDVAGAEHWYRLTTLPHVPDTNEAALTFAAARVALLGARWSAPPEEPIEYETPGVKWRLIHGHINDDARPFIVLDGYSAVFGQKLTEERADLAWSGFQALFLPGLAKIVDLLSLRTGVLLTPHLEVQSMRVSTDQQHWFLPLGLTQLDPKRLPRHVRPDERMDFGAGVRRDPGQATISPAMAHVHAHLDRPATDLRHELLLDAKRIEVVDRGHNTSLSEHEWLNRSRFMILSMAMECAVRDLARHAGGETFRELMDLHKIPSFVAESRPDWDLGALPELLEAFHIVRELRNAVAHARRRCRIDDDEHDVDEALARFTIYLSRAIWQIVSFCDGCLEGWDWAAERAKAPLPPRV